MGIDLLQGLHQLSLFGRNLAGESEIPYPFRIFQLSPETVALGQSPSGGVLESSLQALA